MKRKKVFYLLLLTLIVSIALFLLTHTAAGVFSQALGWLMLLLTGLWLLSLAIKDASIIDIFWGIGFVVVVWFYAFMMGFEKMGERNWLFLSLVTLWGVRLAGYLAIRNLGKGEDYRYSYNFV